MVWKGMTGAFNHRGKQGEKTESDDGDDETVIMDNESFNQEPPERNGPTAIASREARAPSASTIVPSSPAPSSTMTPSSYARVMDTRAVRCLNKWYDMVRLAHLTAARTQAVERVEIIQQVYRREEAARSGGDSRADTTGWGPRSYTVREKDGDLTHEQAISSSEEEDSDDETLAPTQVGRDREVHARHRRDHTMDELTIEPARIEAAIEEERRQPSSMWWWGPLRRWRLQDATMYS